VTITQTGNSTDVVENGKQDRYRVVLDSEPTENVTITITPDSQTDLGEGAEQPIELTFTPSNWDTVQTVTVEAVDDGDVEGEHTSTLVHQVSSEDADYNNDVPIIINGTATNTIEVNIKDNDNPPPPGTAGITFIEPVRRLDVIEGEGSDLYKVVLDSEPTARVTVTIAPDDQTETNKNQLTFTPQNWNKSQTVKVTGVEDSVIEGKHTSTITHIAHSKDERYQELEKSLDVTVNDNDNSESQTTQQADKSVTALSEKDDRLQGTPAKDVIHAGVGNDMILGDRGDDIIYGQQGADRLQGGNGNDIILGGVGDDNLSGDAGDDLIHGDEGSDRIFGGDGSDRLFGDWGNDYLSGDVGVDTLTGGLGNDAFAIDLNTGATELKTAADVDLIVDFNPNQDRIDLGTLTFEEINLLEVTEGVAGYTALQNAETQEYLAILKGVLPEELDADNFI
jgi:Ca2+-binding RTX toxin-like protein